MKHGIRKLMLFLLVVNSIFIGGCSKKDVEIDKDIPMGRYVEQDVTGNIRANRVYGFFKTKEGILQLYLGDDQGLQIYEQDQTGNWIRARSEWLYELDRSMRTPESIARDKKGNIYILYHEFSIDTMDFSTCLAKVEGKKIEKIEIKWQGERQFRAPHSFSILDNGDLLIAENQKPIECYSLSDGSFVKNYEGVATRFTVFNNKIYQINPEQSAIEVYDVDTDKLERSIPCERIDANTIIQVEEEIYLIGRFGIKHLMKEGSIWELIVDENLSTLSMPSNICKYAGMVDKDIFVTFKKNDGGIAIKKYSYSKEMPVTPSTELIVYTLRENNSLRQIITQYQLSHPDIKVTVQVGVDEKSTLTQEDAIKALNTELLAGKGPDLIVLDGLDINSYIEKGILADMDSWVKVDEETKKCLKNILETYRIKGKIYALPMHFTIPTLWGDKKVVQEVKSIEDLAAYQKAHPDERVLSYKTPEELINLFYTTSRPNWFDNEGRLQEKQMISFLQAVKVLANKGEILEGKKEQSIEEIRKPGIDLADEADVIDVAYHYADTQLVRPGKMLDLLITDATNTTRGDSDFVPFESQSGKVFEPRTILGINAGSKKQEMAKEIIKFALSEEIQKVDVEDGFPVNEEALEYWIQGESLPPDNAWGIFGERDGKECWVYLSWAQSNIKVFTKYHDYCKEVKVPVVVDETILKIIVDESKKYFEGTMTIQEAVEAIKNKTEFYFAEG